MTVYEAEQLHEAMKKPSTTDISSNCGHNHGDMQCATCPEEYECRPGKHVQPAATDDRLYTMVTIRCYETACTPTVIDEFYINAWATKRQFEAIKEFFLMCAKDMEVVE